MTLKTKFVDCASIGRKTTEPLARKLDELLPKVPEALRTPRFKSSLGQNPELDIEERSCVGWVSTGKMDKDLEIVEPQGVMLDDYRLNPVVLFGHDQLRPAGYAKWIKPNNEGIIAKPWFPKRELDYVGEWIPDFVFAMIKAEVLRGFSIGFVPLEIRDPLPEEVELYPNIQSVITKSILFEFSVVSCPANPYALVSAVGKGLSLKGWNWEKIGQIKKKPEPKLNCNKKYTWEFDPERIAQKAVENILRKWEV